MSQFLVCVSSSIYPASLQANKLYRTIPDDLAAAKGFIRVIDESGEDYLYPRQLFATADNPGVMAIKPLVSGTRSTMGGGRKKPKAYAKSLMTKGLRPVASGFQGFDLSVHKVRRSFQSDGLYAPSQRPKP